MKRLILVTILMAALSLPIVAQTVGGPIQLRNPHRRGTDTPTGEAGNTTEVAPLFSISGGKLVPLASLAPPAVAMHTDGPYLFVLRGDSLYQFDKKTLKLINSTELPRPVAPPTPAPAQGELKSNTSPPLHPDTAFKIGPNF
ncbi:hypothetical protein EON83_14275 [bacterium]|nr:MAG: hypothetical protein EON83_14275 [bacterium]